MVFFNSKSSDSGGESLIVGRQWWLFPAITIPLTILVFAIWVVWQQYRKRVIYISRDAPVIRTIHPFDYEAPRREKGLRL